MTEPPKPYPNRPPRIDHESGILCATHKVYSLSCEEYEQMWARADGHCEACGQAIDRTKRDHAIDHDHRYGITAVRGIVCARCNGYLARLETPRFRPTFISGPGRWFRSYFLRAWFMYGSNVGTDLVPVNHSEFRAELRTWSAYNRHLFTRDPKAAVISTDKPSEIAKVLRREMSPQGFAALVRILNREAQTPKRIVDANPAADRPAA
ncbi:endonuclease domain-containing protein [Streptomyces sp. A-14]|uniref:endonuclease domain-containing protein n=1 Tax=Streptomyces sp. A-14 TaxID=3127467 RepID=UPI003EBFF3E2